MAIVAYLLGTVLFLSFLRLLRGRGHPPYPPGPPKKFLFGNASDFPRKALAQVFTEWGKKYNSEQDLGERLSLYLHKHSGGIVHAGAFGRHLVVINDREIAEDLFERRASLYNNRPWVAILPL